MSKHMKAIPWLILMVIFSFNGGYCMMGAVMEWNPLYLLLGLVSWAAWAGSFLQYLGVYMDDET